MAPGGSEKPPGALAPSIAPYPEKAVMNMNVDRECTSKVRYSSEGEAACRANTLFYEGLGHQWAYRCYWCRGYHLTSSRAVPNE